MVCQRVVAIATVEAVVTEVALKRVVAVSTA
jgi:hypothetical protein